MKSVLTADLGGTKCRFARVTADLRVLDVRRVATGRDRASFLAAMLKSFGEIRGIEHRGVDAPCAVGIGTTGVVHRDGRFIDRAPNLPLEDSCALADELERALQLPTTLINDGRASAVGEYDHGYAKAADPLLAIFFGTGIGIGLMVDGRPYDGVSNAAGEIGHTPYVPGGRLCVCGRLGCYESYCAGGGICARAADDLGAPAGGAERWTVSAIVEAAATDERAKKILIEAEQAASALIAGACTLLNPQAVVLGGGVFQGWPALRETIETRTRQWCEEIVTRDLVFVRSRGESDAILWGAASATCCLW